MDNNKIPTIDLGTYNRADFPSVDEMAEKIQEDAIDVLQTAKTESTQHVIIQSLPHGDLLKVLYFLFDMFNDFRIQFFPVKETARAMLAGNQLEGDTIHIGIRSLEWTSDNKLIVETCMENDHVEKLSETDNTAEYEKDGVKIVFHFYPDNECITYLSSIDYEFEKWTIPQRFDEFCEKYDK